MKKIARYLIQPPRGDGQRPMHDPKEPIWNMSIEDLLVVPAEQIALAQKGPFVINLASASTPARIPGVIPGFEQRRTYRLSQTEHGRPRYRVRMGFFDNREEAELALNKLRDKYPGAFVTSAREADLRYAPEDIATRARAQRKEAPAQSGHAAKPAPEAKPAPQAKRPPVSKEPSKETRAAAPAPAATPAPAAKKPVPRTTGPAAHRDADENDPDAITDIREQPDFSDILGPEPEIAPPAPAKPKTRSSASDATEKTPAKPAPAPVTAPEPAPRGVTRKNRLPGRYETSSEPAARSSAPSAPSGPSESGRKVLEAVLGTPAKKPHKTSTHTRPGAPRTTDKRAAHGAKSHAAPSHKPSPAAKPGMPPKAPPAETTMEALALIAEAVLAFDDDHGIDDHLTITQPAIPPAAAKIESPVAKVEAPAPAAESNKPKVSAPPVAEIAAAIAPIVELPVAKTEPPAAPKVKEPVAQAEVAVAVVAPPEPPVAAPIETIAPVAVAAPAPAPVVEVSRPAEPIAAVVAEIPVVTEIADVSEIPVVTEIPAVSESEIVEIEVASIAETLVEVLAASPAPPAAVEPVIETRMEVPVEPKSQTPAIAAQAADDLNVALPVTTAEVVEISIGLTAPTADTLTPDVPPGSPADEGELVEFTFTEADPVGRSFVDLVAVTHVPPASTPAEPAPVISASPVEVAPPQASPPPAAAPIESAPVAVVAAEAPPAVAAAEVESTDDVPTWVRAARIESLRVEVPPDERVRAEDEAFDAALLLELKAELAAIDPPPAQSAPAQAVSEPEPPRKGPAIEKPAVEITLSLLEEPPLETPPVDLKFFHDEAPVRESRPHPGAPAARKAPDERKAPVERKSFFDRKPPVDRKPSFEHKPSIERKPIVERKEMPKPLVAKEPVKPPEPVKPTPAPSPKPAIAKNETDLENSIAVALKSIVRQSKPTLPADAPTPELDSTQTLRVLTDDELRDKAGIKWFAVQLACSEHPANLQLMPRLEIFAEYQLYSVAGTVDGKLCHMLRMGFFKDEVAARTVTAYMTSFFDGPTVARVSAAEHERFSRRVLPKQAPVPEAPQSVRPGPVAPPPPAPIPKGVSFVEKPKDRRATDRKRNDTSESAIRRMPENTSIWKRLFK